MATRVGKQEELTDLLTELIEFDLNAVEAYQAAIDRLASLEWQEQLRVFMADHQRHAAEVGLLLHAAGGQPPAGPSLKQAVTRGKVIFADVVGDDESILLAMKSNEDDSNTAYERCAQRQDLPPDVSACMHKNLEDERRHHAWIAAKIESIRVHDKQLAAQQQNDMPGFL